MLKTLSISGALVTLLASPTLAQSTVYVFDPPSNIRNRPNGEIICSVNRKSYIDVYWNEGQWYYTDECGGGYIHQSQFRWQSSSDPRHSTARVVGIKTGQLALRDAPNGASLAGLNNGNTVRVLQQSGNWAYVEVISGPNSRVNGMRGWVNSHYLALF